ncbi:MAG TPA: DUF2530 domain-containing protein [Lapillicoccus sp.]|nr:DUF2530 domain-containing protein [Lapillicoccus sp.]
MSSSGRVGEPPPAEELRPVAVPMTRIVEIGLVVWAVALVVCLVVPALREGSRSWWPWCCVAGIVLGLAGLGYLRRGRGNAAEASSPDA